ncbi:hypothetical protein [Pseudomonas aeruginosa]
MATDPFADAIKLVESPDQVKVLDAEDIEASDSVQGSKADLEDDQRDILPFFRPLTW